MIRVFFADGTTEDRAEDSRAARSGDGPPAVEADARLLRDCQDNYARSSVWMVRGEWTAAFIESRVEQRIRERAEAAEARAAAGLQSLMILRAAFDRTCTALRLAMVEQPDDIDVHRELLRRAVGRATKALTAENPEMHLDIAAVCERLARGAGEHSTTCAGCEECTPCVCPGCHATAGEAHAPYCADEAIEREREDRRDREEDDTNEERGR